MKTTSYCLLVLCILQTWAVQAFDPFAKAMDGLPQRARECDMAGVGTVTGVTVRESIDEDAEGEARRVTLDVQAYWHGTKPSLSRDLICTGAHMKKISLNT